MKKIETLKKIIDKGIISVIRTESQEKAFKILDAVKKGGIEVIEITMTTPGAVNIIKEAKEKYKNEDIIIGAGTVLDSESARICILAGAEFIVSAYLDVETVKLCNKYGIPVVPGIMTVRDAIEALEYGVEILKIFPGNVYGPSVISSFKGPIPQGNFMPSGGVNVDNVKDWIKAGALLVSTGSELTKGAKEDNYDLITETAIQFVNEINKARLNH